MDEGSKRKQCVFVATAIGSTHDWDRGETLLNCTHLQASDLSRGKSSMVGKKTGKVAAGHFADGLSKMDLKEKCFIACVDGPNSNIGKANGFGKHWRDLVDSCLRSLAVCCSHSCMGAMVHAARKAADLYDSNRDPIDEEEDEGVESSDDIPDVQLLSDEEGDSSSDDEGDDNNTDLDEEEGEEGSSSDEEEDSSSNEGEGEEGEATSECKKRKKEGSKHGPLEMLINDTATLFRHAKYRMGLERLLGKKIPLPPLGVDSRFRYYMDGCIYLKASTRFPEEIALLIN